MLDRVASVTAYRGHTAADNDVKVKVKDKVNVKVTKQSDVNKSSAGGQTAVQFRSVSFFARLVIFENLCIHENRKSMKENFCALCVLACRSAGR